MKSTVVKITKTKIRNLFTIAFICVAGLISCSKDDDTNPSTSEATNIMGIEKWEKGQKMLDVDFILKDNVIASFQSDRPITYAFSHNGTKVTKIEMTYSGGNKTITIMYNGDKMTGMTAGSKNYEFEFSADNPDRVEQLNIGSNRFYEFTYTGENITKIEETLGALDITYDITYDDKENPFYNHMNIRAFTTSAEVYSMAPHNWALGYLLTLTKNNPVKISNTQGNVWQNNYYRTGSKLDSIVQDWTLKNGTVITNKYVLTY